MFKVMQHLLPNGRAWRTTSPAKPLKKLVEGLSAWGGDVRASLDTDYDELRPETTGALNEWEYQFGLPPTLTANGPRRSRLSGAWRAFGGQSPYYIQTTLQNAGFDVYVHEWWVPGTERAPVVRDPLDYLSRNSDGSLTDVIACGYPGAVCNGPTMLCGNFVGAPGLPLVNKVPVSVLNLSALCGAALMVCGGPSALANNGVDYSSVRKVYSIPSGAQYWPHFIYIGGATFPQLASVPSSRREEFEELCLKIRPLGKWLGMLVNYT
jgi:hypothetical protein